MIKPRKRKSCLWAALAKIHLIDKCLLLFMIILLLQSAFILLFEGPTPSGGNSFDIIVRTSIAAIFGYFLSANFIKHETAQKEEETSVSKPVSIKVSAPEGTQNRIGFADPDTSGESPKTGGASSTPEPRETLASRLQIITATSIGLFCLIVLILLRDLVSWRGSFEISPSAAATVSQFRDLVSGCVGFLIGCPTHKPSK